MRKSKDLYGEREKYRDKNEREGDIDRERKQTEKY